MACSQGKEQENRSTGAGVYMKIIYVAGPYRGKPTHGQSENISRARIAARKLWAEGWGVLCPHLNTAWFDTFYPEIPTQAYLDGGLEMVKRCDAIFILKDWEISEGSKAELACAINNGLEVIYE